MQGGIRRIDVSDFTDPIIRSRSLLRSRSGRRAARPVDTTAAAGGGGRFRSTIGGSWGAYYWNGYIYSSELARGFDILELLPTTKLSANEIAAAKLVRMTEYNPQSQPHYTFPAAFPVIRSYLDQLRRNNGLAAERTTAIDKALTAAEAQKGEARGAALTKLASQVDKDANGAGDASRVQAMAKAMRDLAAVSK